MNNKELQKMEDLIQNTMFEKTVTLHIELTPDQIDQLYFAAGLLYLDYEEHQSDEYNASIRKYNDGIDGIRDALKSAIELLKGMEKTPCKN